MKLLVVALMLMISRFTFCPGGEAHRRRHHRTCRHDLVLQLQGAGGGLLVLGLYVRSTGFILLSRQFLGGHEYRTWLPTGVYSCLAEYWRRLNGCATLSLSCIPLLTRLEATFPVRGRASWLRGGDEWFLQFRVELRRSGGSEIHTGWTFRFNICGTVCFASIETFW